jgi:hypothetical protein
MRGRIILTVGFLLITAGAAQAQVQTTLYFPRLASTSGSGGTLDTSEYTGLAFANFDTVFATLTFTAYDRTGVQITGTGITNPATRLLGPNSQIALIDSQIFGTALTSRNPVGWVKVTSTARKVVGFFLTFNGSLSVQDGADVPSTTLTSFVFTEMGDQEANNIHIVNPGTASASVTLEVVRSDGTVRVQVVRQIPANGALADVLQNIVSGTTLDPTDYVRVTSTLGVVPYQQLGRLGSYVAGLNGQDATAGAATLYCPQYVAGGSDYRSTLSIVNLDSTSGTLTLRWVGDDGTQIGNTRTVPIASRGKVSITNQDFFADAGALRQGYLVVSSSGPKIAGSVVFGDLRREVFSASLPLVSKLAGDLVFSQVASNQTYFTGVALLNSGAADANAVVEVTDSFGLRVASKLERIPAGQRISRLLTQFFPSLEGANRTSGFIRVLADASIASFALFGTNNLSVLSAVPPQVLDANRAALPRIGSISPTSAQRNTTLEITIDGINFQNATGLQFTVSSGVTVSNFRATATRITATVALASGATASNRTVAVLTPAGTSNTLLFEVRRFGSPPVISNISVNTPTLGSGGATITGSFDFTDPDGDIVYTGTRETSAELIFGRQIGVNTCWVQGTGAFLDKQGQTSGRVEFSLTYSFGSITLGSVSISFTLQDADGNQSNTLNFTSNTWYCDRLGPLPARAAPPGPQHAADRPRRLWLAG